MESILTSIKKLLGLAEDDTSFDMDVIMHINSVFMVLSQLGIGPEKGFFIEDETSTWNDYLMDSTQLELVKSYIYLKVKLLFDPYTSSSAQESANRMINEFEWRLNVAAESNKST